MNPRLERLYAASPAFLQDLYVSWYGLRIRRQRFNAEHERWMEIFSRSERWSREELRAWQDQRLAALVRHCWDEVPFYRRVMEERRLRPEDVRRAGDLPKLPIIDKDLIRRHAPEMIARGLRREDLKESPTSGTTGASFTVWWDRATDVLWNALLWRHRGWAGFRFGDRYATLLGRMVVPVGRRRPPFWRRNHPWNQVLYSSFHLHGDNIPAYVASMRRLGVTALECYPSTGYILARFLEGRGETLPLGRVVTSSETLLPIQRELIQSRFATKVFDYYGMSEAVLFGGECGASDGYHLNAEIGICEVVDAGGAPLPPGRHGRVLGTGLVNHAMPLLRYEIGDVSALRDEPCPCGRTLPRLDAVTTKAEDIVVTPDGRMISSSALTHPFKPLDRIEKSQIVQEAIDRMVIRIVPRDGYTEAHTRHLIEEMRQRVGEAMTIDVMLVDDIPRAASGKYRWVISKLPLDFRRGRIGNLYGADVERPA